MNGSLTSDIEVWEGEGGATPAPRGACAAPMSGTASHVEWAERVKRRVNAGFDHVAASLGSIVGRQSAGKRADTEAVIAILGDQRAEEIEEGETDARTAITALATVPCSGQHRGMGASDDDLTRFQAAACNKLT